MDKRTYPTLFENVPEFTTEPGSELPNQSTQLNDGDRIDLTSAPAPSPPISSIMNRNLWTVHAEDTIEKVQEAMHHEGLSSVPVMGSNGVIVGIIGARELAEFTSASKNPKVICAWEVSRCTDFEVPPETTIAEVSSLMTHDRIEYIAVTSQGVLLGAVTALDILRANEDSMHDS